MTTIERRQLSKDANNYQKTCTPRHAREGAHDPVPFA